MTNRGFSIGSKNATQQKQEIPGPGQYDDLRGVHAGKRSVPAYRIGTAPRGNSYESLNKSDFPGPGAYENGYKDN
jgi:hypothetical protein